MRKLTAAGWFWLTYAIVGILVLASLLTWCSSARAEVPTFKIGNPICPNGFCVQQRYDEWRHVDGRLQIVKSTWVLYPATHRIIYASH